MKTLVITSIALAGIASAAPRDWNIPIRAIGNSSVNTTVPNIETWGFLINNPTLPNPVVPGALGFAQLLPWNQDVFTIDGGGQLALSPNWLDLNYMPRGEAETEIQYIESQISGLQANQFSGDYNDLYNKPVLFSGSWNDLTNRPYIFSGSWNDLTNKPTLFSGAYNDLTGKPTLFSGAYADLTGKPILFSGSYNDLTNKPTIPAAQVQSDWNATTGLGVVLNKPTIPTNTNQLTNGAGFITGITSGNVTTALGYTPYNSSNPSGYISGINSSMINAALGYSPYNGATNPSGFLTTIDGSQVVVALGYTPYNGSTNPNSYVNPGGARAAISLTTTGSGAASYNSTTGVLNVPTPATVAARVFNNSPARTIQTVAAAANGWQIDASRDSEVGYSVTITTSLSLTGGTSGYVVLEINTSNSTTGWVEIDRVTSGQAGSGLVVGLAMNNSGGGSVRGIVPAGNFVRIRSVNSSGTPTYVYNSGQEVKL